MARAQIPCYPDCLTESVEGVAVQLEDLLPHLQLGNTHCCNLKPEIQVLQIPQPLCPPKFEK